MGHAVVRLGIVAVAEDLDDLRPAIGLARVVLDAPLEDLVLGVRIIGQIVPPASRRLVALGDLVVQTNHLVRATSLATRVDAPLRLTARLGDDDRVLGCGQQHAVDHDQLPLADQLLDDLGDLLEVTGVGQVGVGSDQRGLHAARPAPRPGTADRFASLRLDDGTAPNGVSVDLQLESHVG